MVPRVLDARYVAGYTVWLGAIKDWWPRGPGAFMARSCSIPRA